MYWNKIFQCASGHIARSQFKQCRKNFHANAIWHKLKNGSKLTYKQTVHATLTETAFTAISKKVVGKSARNNPKRNCGWFWVHCSSKKFKRMAREALEVCLSVLKEVRQLQCQEQCIDHIPYYLSGLSHAHFFWQRFSK